MDYLVESDGTSCDNIADFFIDEISYLLDTEPNNRDKWISILKDEEYQKALLSEEFVQDLYDMLQIVTLPEEIIGEIYYYTYIDGADIKPELKKYLLKYFDEDKKDNFRLKLFIKIGIVIYAIVLAMSLVIK